MLKLYERSHDLARKIPLQFWAMETFKIDTFFLMEHYELQRKLLLYPINL